MDFTKYELELLESSRQREARGLTTFPGWENAMTAPDWAKRRIINTRLAIVEHREAPSLTPEEIRGSETRSAATNFVRRLFKRPTAVSEDEQNRKRLVEISQQIRKDAITDPTCTHVYLGTDGFMHRDYAAESLEQAQRKAHIATLAQQIHEAAASQGVL